MEITPIVLHMTAADWEDEDRVAYAKDVIRRAGLPVGNLYVTPPAHGPGR